MRRTLHEIFSGHFVSFVVKKYHCHPDSLSHYSRSGVIFYDFGDHLEIITAPAAEIQPGGIEAGLESRKRSLDLP